MPALRIFRLNCRRPAPQPIMHAGCLQRSHCHKSAGWKHAVKYGSRRVNLANPPQNLSVCAWSAHIDSAAWETEAGLVTSCCHMPRNSRRRLLASRCATSTDEKYNTRWAPEQISCAWKRLFSTRECFAGEGEGLLELAGRSEAGRCGSKGTPGWLFGPVGEVGIVKWMQQSHGV